MRFFLGLFAYLIGVSVVISIAIIGLMALQSPLERAPSAPSASAASQDEHLARPIKQSAITQKKVHPDRKKKMMHVSRKPRHEAPTTDEASYGYAEEPRRRIEPNLFSIFGR
jgi:ABC-type antimicrobial peptide transport system permease subunit